MALIPFGKTTNGKEAIYQDIDQFSQPCANWEQKFRRDKHEFLN
jgi:hypothetical protein